MPSPPRPAWRRRGLPGLPPELAGPVAVELAKPVTDIPRPSALPGGCVYEPKWDGYRLVVVRTAGCTRLWSKQGRDLTDRFPDVAAAALAQVPAGTVLDGEVVVWNGSRLDFGLLQQRMVSAVGRIAGLVAAHPASYVAFDLLAGGRAGPARAAAGPPPGGAGGRRRPVGAADAALAVDDRPRPRPGSGSRTSGRPGSRAWSPRAPTPATRRAAGSGSRSSPGRPPRCSRAVSSARSSSPSQLVAGRYRDGELVVVGRTSPLSPASRPSSPPSSTPAGGDHPWPDRIGTGRFGGGRLSVPLTRVAPEVVVEVSADAALQAGVFRHPLRYVRIRPDLRPDDVAPID